MIPDHYQVLGIHPGASVEEIAAAYRRVMRANHPDHRPGDATAADIARQANEAWRILGDADRRAAYEGGTGQRPATIAPVKRQPIPDPYSPEGHHYRRAFSVACFKVAAAVFALGLAALLSV